MDASRRFDIVAVVGFGCWLVVSALVATATIPLGGPTTAALAVGLAVFVIVPLVARLADLPFRTGNRSRWYRSASLLSFPAALLAIVSLSVPAGSTAALFTLPWLVVVGLLAIFGLQRGVPNVLRPAELAISVSLLYLPVAGAALLAHRADLTFGFGPDTMLLTVVHFQYAGGALPAFVGLLGREFEVTGRYRALLGVVLVGPGLIAIGIAFSPLIELVAASVFATVVAAIAVYALVVIRPREVAGHALVGVAAISVAVSMGIVATFLLSRSTPVALVGLRTMFIGHGWLNAVGFALVGLVGWRLANPPPTAPPLGMPISRLTARGRVGAEYLDRYDLTAEGTATGMVDGFAVFDGPTCDPGQIADDVKGFYERTADYELRIEPTWERGFRLSARLYALLGRRVEQMNFPVFERDPETLSSRIVPVDDRADGRQNVRAWIRTYEETGAAIYVALYATHVLDGRPYMNIAFPLPYTNLTSVLTIEPSGETEPDGIVLSTRSSTDAGIYLRTPIGPLRLPMDETIRVWAADMRAVVPDEFDGDDADLFARHDMFLFGRRFLRLDYRMSQKPNATASTVGIE